MIQQMFQKTYYIKFIASEFLNLRLQQILIIITCKRKKIKNKHFEK